MLECWSTGARGVRPFVRRFALTLDDDQRTVRAGDGPEVITGVLELRKCGIRKEGGDAEQRELLNPGS